MTYAEKSDTELFVAHHRNMALIKNKKKIKTFLLKILFMFTYCLVDATHANELTSIRPLNDSQHQRLTYHLYTLQLPVPASCGLQVAHYAGIHRRIHNADDCNQFHYTDSHSMPYSASHTIQPELHNKDYLLIEIPARTQPTLTTKV